MDYKILWEDRKNILIKGLIIGGILSLLLTVFFCSQTSADVLGSVVLFLVFLLAISQSVCILLCIKSGESEGILMKLMVALFGMIKGMFTFSNSPIVLGFCILACIFIGFLLAIIMMINIVIFPITTIFYFIMSKVK